MDIHGLFRYDSWANGLWLPVILQEGAPEEQAAFRHILVAQAVWLARVRGEEGTPSVEGILSKEGLESLHRGWMELLAGEADLQRVISFRRLDGEPMSGVLLDIAFHVVNHGTYHRGHIRGLMQARGFDGFPETDLIRFCREERAS